MTCPRCHFEFERPAGECPECGLHLMRSVSGVMKTSAVMIAAGQEQTFYRSVQDVPEPLRTQLLATTTSSNSGTILIADRAGKEQLTEVMARRDAAVSHPDRATPGQPAPLEKAAVKLFGVSWMAWTGALLVLAVALIIAVVFGLRW